VQGLGTLGPYELDRVYQGDCLELMQAIPDGSVPMIWTDPPYGISDNGTMAQRREAVLGWKDGVDVYRDGEAAFDNLCINDGHESMERVVRRMLKEAGRILSTDCCCCLCCGGGGPTPVFAKVALWLNNKPLQFFHAVVWDKGGLGMGWKYRRNYEFIMIAHKSGGKLLWNYDGAGKETANVVRIKKIIPQAEEHPTPKPVELVEHFLRLHTKPGDVVLDPFAGSGPVGVACAKLDRRYIGFELDQKWVTLANDRIKAQNKCMGVNEMKAGQTTWLI